MENNYLAHHGVKGQKWGVQNAETAARYARDRTGKKSSSSSFKEAVKAGVRTRVTNTVENAKSAALKRISGEAKREAKSRGYDSVKEYQNARNKALYSHNPETVAKYASTLTDQELQNKLKRLSLEKQVLDLVPPKTKSAGQQAAENFTNNFAKSAGSNLGPVAAQFIANKLKVSTNKQSENSESNEKDKSNNSNNDTGSNHNSNSSSGSGSNSNNSAIANTNSRTNTGNNKPNSSNSGSDGRNDKAGPWSWPLGYSAAKAKAQQSSSAITKEPEVSNTQTSSPPINITLNFGGASIPKDSIEKGSKVIKKVIDDDIIDVKPISASSEREAKGFLSKFKKKD